MKLTDKPYYKQPWYNSYRAMMSRCYRLKDASYARYGGRGIKVCEEWHDINKFAEWCEASGYQEGLTIDRINTDGDYEPSNCRWATKKEQANNRCNTPKVTIDGVTKTLEEWAVFSGINCSTLKNRYWDGVRGVMLLHRAENTKFKKGYNRYGDSKHYKDYVAPTVIEGEEDVSD